MECVAHSEIEDYPRRILRQHWPKVPLFGDIKGIRGKDLPQHDVISAGIPCQGNSTAGKRKGVTDARWLWPEVRRLVDECRPSYLIVENPPGLLSVNAGEAFAQILGGLDALGYAVEWTVFSAARLGARHLRKRVWVVAYPVAGPDAGGGGGGQQVREGVREGRQEPVAVRGRVGSDTSSQRRNRRTDHAAENTESRNAPRSVFGERARAVLDDAYPGPWHPECRLGGALHGLPGGPQHPEGWGWACGIPSVRQNQPHWEERIKAIGNAAVPQCAEVVGKLILLHAAGR